MSAFLCHFKLVHDDKNDALKGHWTSVTSSPDNFNKNIWDFYVIRSVGISNNYLYAEFYLLV